MSGGNLRGSISCPEGVYHVPRKFKRGISLLYHGCYRSNHSISICYSMGRSDIRDIFVGIAAVKSHEAKPSAISPLYRKRVELSQNFTTARAITY